MEKEKNTKKFNRTVIAIVVVLIIVIGILVRVFGNSSAQKSILTAEVDRLVKTQDLSKNTIDVNDIKTKGDYAKVEKAIKTYLNDYAVEVQNLIAISQDDKISKLLSIDNYKEDGPDFEESIPYIEETLKKLEESSEKTIKLMDKDEMFNYIKSYNLSSKYEELYKSLMLDEETEKDLKTAQETLQKSIDQLKNNLEVAKETLTFLKENQSSWEISGSKVMFNNASLLSQYNQLVKKLK